MSKNMKVSSIQNNSLDKNETVNINLNENSIRKSPATTVETFVEKNEQGGVTTTNNINISGTPKVILQELDKINIENKEQVKEMIKNIDYDALLKAKSFEYMDKLMKDSMTEILYEPKNNVFNTMIYIHNKGVRSPRDDPIVYSYVKRLAEYLAEKTSTKFKECFREYNRKILSDPYEFLTYIDEGIEDKLNNESKHFVDNNIEQLEEIILESIINIVYPKKNDSLYSMFDETKINSDDEEPIFDDYGNPLDPDRYKLIDEFQAQMEKEELENKLEESHRA